jgi:hypothetical protein
MADFEKYPYEEVFRYYEFARTDGRDGLASDETLSSCTVACVDADGTDCSTAMISNAAVVENTQVKYKLKAGSAGTSYTVIVKAVTSTGQKLEGTASIDVVSE